MDPYAQVPTPRQYPYGDPPKRTETISENQEEVYFRITKTRHLGSATITRGYTKLPENFVPNPNHSQTWVRRTPDFIYYDTIIPPTCNEQSCLQKIFEVQELQRRLKRKAKLEEGLKMTFLEWEEWEEDYPELDCKLGNTEFRGEEDVELIHDGRELTFFGEIRKSGDECGCEERRARLDFEKLMRQRARKIARERKRLQDLECGCERRAREAKALELRHQGGCGCKARAEEISRSKKVVFPSTPTTPTQRASNLPSNRNSASFTSPQLPTRRSSMKKSKKEAREEIGPALALSRFLPNQTNVNQDPLPSPAISSAETFVSARDYLAEGNASRESVNTLTGRVEDLEVEMMGVAI